MLVILQKGGVFVFLLEINRNIDPIVKACGEWLSELNVWSIIIRLFVALICGGIIGVERATKRHAAGFRTYILVTLGATIATLTNQFICEYFNNGDAARLGAQVISGIGFLGAGTILVTSRSQIKGLTTAAGLWACACVGLCIGIGFYTLAILSCVIIIISLTFFPIIEYYFTERTRSCELHIEFEVEKNLKDFIAYARSNDMRVKTIEHNPAYASTGLSVYTIVIEAIKIKGKKTKNHLQIMDEIRTLPYVNYVEEIY